MAETERQPPVTEAAAAQGERTLQGERTFTQSEMNAILQDRLARERGKYADYETLKAKAEQFDRAEAAEKTELQKASERAQRLQAQLDSLTKAAALQKMRAAVAEQTSVPQALLSADTEEACTAQAQAILNFAKQQAGYPVVKDGGGPVQNPTGSPGEQFAAWFEQSAT